MTKHSYDLYRGDKSSSEHQHLRMLNPFQTRVSHEVFKTTKAEKEKIKAAQSDNPAGKGSPVFVRGKQQQAQNN